MRHLLLSAALGAALAGPAAAASGYAGEFLALGTGARAMALGSAYVTLADDATAGYWNPAALPDVKARHAHLMHSERFSGLVQQNYVAVALAGRRTHGFALSLIRVGVDDIPFTTLQDPASPLGPDNRPVVASMANSADYALYLSGGKRLSSRLALGTSLKLIYRSVGSYSARGLGLDVGLRFRLSSTMTLAASIRDVTSTPVFWNTDTTDRINPSVLVGLAYSQALGGGRATLAVASKAGGDAADESGATPVNAGLEYWYRSVALRAGFEHARQALGIGLRPHERVELDLAYLQHDELEATYRISAGLWF